jgi:hypothetical protein
VPVQQLLKNSDKLTETNSKEFACRNNNTWKLRI